MAFMHRKDFDEKIRFFNEGDWIKLVVRRMGGNYQVEDKFKKVDDRGFVHLDKGLVYSYKNLITLY